MNSNSSLQLHTKVRSAAELLKIVQELSYERNSPTSLWFRGVHDQKFSLVPGIYREAHRKVDEDQLINSFFIYSRPFLKNLPESGFDWISLMQHHGCPTRLLDWTESCFVALYFSVWDWKPEQQSKPVVWILDPDELNCKSTGEKTAFIPLTKALVRWLPSELRLHGPEYKKVPRPSRKPPKTPGTTPISIYLSHAHERIAAQKGAFTLHGTYKSCLSTFAKATRMKNLRFVIIDIDRNEQREKILHELDLAGVNSFSIFPGLDNLSKYSVWFQRNRS